MYAPWLRRPVYIDHECCPGCCPAFYRYIFAPRGPYTALPGPAYCICSTNANRVPRATGECISITTLPYATMTGRCVAVPVLENVSLHHQQPPSYLSTMGNTSSCLGPVPALVPDQPPKDASDKECKTFASGAFSAPLRQLQPSGLDNNNARWVAPLKRYGPAQPRSRYIATCQLKGRGRLRRVTKRVAGVRTPQPYQKRRRTMESLQNHILLLPGDEELTGCGRSQRTSEHLPPYLDTDYEEDVMTYLLEVEQRYLMTRSYLPSHPSVNKLTRAILVDWLIQVQSYLELSQETLYQSVALVDRILQVRSVPVHRVQLLAITALLIVTKLEEKHPVETSMLLQLTLDSYTHEELLSLERHVLVVLGFQLTYADPSVFLNYFLYLTCNSNDQMVVWCSGFLVDVVMVEEWPLESRPSLLAAGALYGALRVLRGALAVTPLCAFMPTFFGLDEVDVAAQSVRMLEALANRSHSRFQGAVNKYLSKSHYNSLAKHSCLAPDNIFIVVEHTKTRLSELRGSGAAVVKETPLSDKPDSPKYIAVKDKDKFGVTGSWQTENSEAPVAMDAMVCPLHTHCGTRQSLDVTGDSEEETMEIVDNSDIQLCACAHV
ncbi:uncharacterized protein [Procambarus clarkii]|uniref:uncharacterized protein n=1 Tax=Procambarus clarkii TaxID=6728 RepID=UPI003744AC69